jgi:hypothetical protein
MLATWTEASLRRHIFWTTLAAATTTTYVYCDNILSHARKTKAAAKSPNFLLQTTVPWERISLCLDVINALGPGLWNQNIIMSMICIELSLPGTISPRII